MYVCKYTQPSRCLQTHMQALWDVYIPLATYVAALYTLGLNIIFITFYCISDPSPVSPWWMPWFAAIFTSSSSMRLLFSISTFTSLESWST